MEPATSLTIAAGIIAILLGISAIALAVIGLLVGSKSLRNFEETVRLGLDLLSRVAVSLEKAGDAALNASDSIDEAKRSLGLAARMGNQAASALFGIGTMADVAVLGIHPLRGIREIMGGEGHKMGQMSDQLRATAGSMGDDADNMREMARDLRASGREIENLVVRLASASGGAGLSLFGHIRIAMYAGAFWGAGLGLLLILWGLTVL